MINDVLIYNGLFYIALVGLVVLIALCLRDLLRSFGSFWYEITKNNVYRNKRPFYVNLYNRIMFYLLFDLSKNSVETNIYLILKYDPLNLLIQDFEQNKKEDS